MVNQRDEVAVFIVQMPAAVVEPKQARVTSPYTDHRVTSALGGCATIYPALRWQAHERTGHRRTIEPAREICCGNWRTPCRYVASRPFLPHRQPLPQPPGAMLG
jgi:hypothetical protein